MILSPTGTRAQDEASEQRVLPGQRRPVEVALDLRGEGLAFTERVPASFGGFGHELRYRSRAGDGSRRLVAPELGARGIRFGPEGRWIWFLSAGGGPPQVCRVAVDGEALSVVTALAEGVARFSLGPAGLRLAVVPRGGTAPRLLVLDARSGRTLARQTAGATPSEIAWFPDGTRIACLQPLPDGVDGAPEHRIAVLSAAGGEPEPLHGPVRGRAADLVVCADGRHVALRASGDGGREPRAGRLLIVPVGEGAPRVHFESARFTLVGIGRLGEGDLLFALAVHGFDTRLHVVSPEAGASGELTLGRRPHRAHRVAASGDGRAYAFVSEDPIGEVGLWWARVGAPQPERCLSGGGTDRTALLAPELLTWEAADGTRIEAELLRPAHARDDAPPVVILLPGFEEKLPPCYRLGDGRDLARPLITRGIAVLRPQLPGSVARGAAFAGLAHGRPGDAALAALEPGLAALAKHGAVDAGRLGLLGVGAGGTLALRAAARFATRVRAVAAVGAPTHWLSLVGTTDALRELSWFRLGSGPFADREAWWQRSPLAHAEAITAPVLLVHGAADRAVPPGQSREMHRRLRQVERPAELLLVPEAGGDFARPRHQEALFTAVADHFARHLAGR